jgi:cytochrome b
MIIMKWTLTVRITHWLLAVGVITNLINESGSIHRFIGYACVLLVLLRLIDALWLTSVEASKLHLPRLNAVKLHIQSVFFNQHNHHDKPLYVGHNPLGQYAVYIMWTLILLLGFTGWLSRTDQFWGEDWPVDLHQTLSNVLQGMVVLHLMAVMLLSKKLGKNLVRAMIRGK